MFLTGRYLLSPTQSNVRGRGRSGPWASCRKHRFGIKLIHYPNSYLASSAAANSGSAGAYIGPAAGVKFAHNVLVAYNSGNYGIDLTNAASNQVTLLDNGGSSINNPNNVTFQNIISPGTIQAPNLLWGSNTLISSATTLTTSIAGEGIFFTNSSPITVTLPEAADFQPGSIVYFQNNGGANVTLAVPADDNNQMPGGGNTLGGSSTLPPGAAFYARPNGNLWSAYGFTIDGVMNIPSSVVVSGSIEANSATINGIALATTPATVTLATNPPVSGTAYQWTGPGTLQLACPVTLNPTSSAAASVSLAIGSSSTLGSTMDAFSLPSGATTLAGMTQTEKADVPAGMYYGLTATNATIGTCAAVVH